MTRVPRSFFARRADRVARDMLGLILVHKTKSSLVAGRVVEVEAYLQSGDLASHSAAGRTARNAAMFGPPGRAYVYFIYGVHHCFNVVTGPVGSGEAVLVRALEPLAGLEIMRARRGRESDLCNGPGKLTVALAILLEHDGVDLARGPLGLWRAGDRVPRARVQAGPRIGITRSRDLPLRFRYLRAADKRSSSLATLDFSAADDQALSDRDRDRRASGRPAAASRRPSTAPRPASDRG